MTHKVTVRFGGAADSEVHDYSDRIRLLGDGSPLIYGGMACDNGTAGMGQLILDDEDNDIPHRTEPPGLQLAAHNQLIWSEDSPGYESWLSIGRIDNKTVGRPYTYTAGVNRQWTVQWADANIDFDGLTLTEDWVRPTETDVDRVLAAVAAFCNGSPRLTTVFETHLVSTAATVAMPAKTYPAGTELPELFDDCASQAGKVYSVVIHDLDSTSHTCLLYIDEEDHTTYACTLSISDQLDEVDGETVFEPVWRQGGATEEQGQELITGLVSRYGLDTSATVVVTDSDHADQYDYWVKPYNDDLAASALEATNRATAMVHSRWNEHVTHQPSILIPARLHHLLKAGMSIAIKSAAAMGGQYLDTVQTRRIANIEWSHAGWRGDDAMLWANLQLDRTPRKLPLSIGIKPGPQPPSGSCTDVTATLAPAGFDGESLTHWVQGGADSNPETGIPGPHAGTSYMTFHSLSNPWAGYAFSGTWQAAHTYTIGFWLMVDTNALPCVVTVGKVSSVSGSSNATFSSDKASITISSAETVWTYHEIEWTPTGTYVSDGTTASPNVKFWLAFTADANDGVNFDNGSVQECTDAPVPPASDDDTGSTGDNCTSYACADHKHPAQTAAVTPIADTGGYYTSGNVEGALQEIGAAGGTPYTDEDAQDAVGGMIADTATVNLTYTDATPELKADVIPAGIKLDDLGAADDNTDLNASTSKHGLLRKLSGTATEYLDGSGAWSTPAGGGGGSLTVEEVDGSPTDSAVSKIIFPNGTLSITSHEATYTPSGGGGGGMSHSYLGKTTAGANTENPVAFQQYAKAFTLAQDSLVNSVDVYLKQNQAQQAGTIHVAIYDVASSKPVHVIAWNSPDAQSIMPSRVSGVAGDARWVSMPIGKWLPAGDYFASFQFGPNGTQAAKFDIYYDTSGSDWTWTKGGNTFISDAPDTSGTVYTLVNSTKDYSIRISEVH